MMKNLMYGVIILLLNSCGNTTSLTKGAEYGSEYLIKKIDSVNSWYTIYATRRDSSFKIVAKKDSNPSLECKRIISVGKYYNLHLHSRKNEVPEINGIKVKPVNTIDISCYGYDEYTNICIEPKKGIYDLYHTGDLKGLCYIRQ